MGISLVLEGMWKSAMSQRAITAAGLTGVRSEIFDTRKS